MWDVFHVHAHELAYIKYKLNSVAETHWSSNIHASTLTFRIITRNWMHIQEEAFPVSLVCGWCQVTNPYQWNGMCHGAGQGNGEVDTPSPPALPTFAVNAEGSEPPSDKLASRWINCRFKKWASIVFVLSH